MVDQLSDYPKVPTQLTGVPLTLYLLSTCCAPGTMLGPEVTGVCWFPRATETKHHKQGVLKQQRFILS